METVLENHSVLRGISSKSKWKASEWRSWLLFFGVLCLRDYLPPKCLKHFALLANNIFTLLKLEITEEQLILCDIEMIQFVGQFEILYEQEEMTSTCISYYIS